jgi:hypothetical protein
MVQSSLLTSAPTKPGAVKAVHFTGVKTSVRPIAKSPVVSSKALVKSRMTSVPVAESIAEATASPIEPIVGATSAAKAIVPVSSWPSAVPAAIAGVVAVNKLATLAVAPVSVATSLVVAVIGQYDPG